MAPAAASQPSRIACLWPLLADSRALVALADVASGFSPTIEQSAAAVYVEVGDLRRLYPTEELLLGALADGVAAVGVAATVAIAADKGVARLRARSLALAPSRSSAIVRPGGERQALAALPLSALTGEGPASLLLQLAEWGLTTLGDLAALPRPQLGSRLGPRATQLHRLACGESSELLQPTAPPTEVREELSLLDQLPGQSAAGGPLDRGLDNLEPLLFLLRGLLDRLLSRLRARSQGSGDLMLRLGLGQHGDDIRRVAVAVPMQKVAPLLELLRVALESRPPAAAIERLAIWTLPARLRPVQLDLFAAAGPAPERLATTLARLEALCGSGRVGRPLLADSHTPGAVALTAFVPPPPPTALATTDAVAAPTLLLAPRLLRPPPQVAVSCQADLPTSLAHGRRRDAVRRAGGPYRLRDVRGLRDYYDVELTSGDLLRLFHDLDADRWFLDAVYD
jgi:protein ImuB